MIFNQIDYVLVRQNRRHTLTNARSYYSNTVSTDHRLVICTLEMKIRKNNVKRIIRTEEHPEIRELAKKQKKQKNIFATIRQSTNTENIMKWKKARNQLLNKIEKLRAKEMEKQLTQEAEEINKLPDSSKIHQIVKRICLKKPKKTPGGPSIVNLTEHYKAQFHKTDA